MLRSLSLLAANTNSHTHTQTHMALSDQRNASSSKLHNPQNSSSNCIVAELQLQLQLPPHSHLGLGLSDGSHDLGELWLQSCSANEESVNVRLGRELRRILGIGRAAILDTNSLGDSRRCVLCDELADARVSSLGIPGRGSQARSNGPNRLVSDDDPGRVEKAVDLCQLLVHLGQDRVQALLADLLRLADAKDAVEATVQDVLQLRRQSGVVVHREDAELAASLGMSQQDLSDAHVLHLLDSHLARVGTAASEVTILRCHLGPIGELVEAVGNMQGRGADEDVALGGVACIDVGNEPIQLGLLVRVALPVASHHRPSGSLASHEGHRGSCDSTGHRGTEPRGVGAGVGGGELLCEACTRTRPSHSPQ
mmetsp:Transcript_97637/g.203772  ORF Transcript_97637/g.203772 Transcript_97637/m.203772 type:complete len:367 (+) Transcript_97637:116-1216(+)